MGSTLSSKRFRLASVAATSSQVRGVDGARGGRRSATTGFAAFDRHILAVITRMEVGDGLASLAALVVAGFVLYKADEAVAVLIREPDAANSGRPRALYATTFSIDQVNERLDVTKACEYRPLEQCGRYEYFVTLTPPFTTASNTRY